MTISFTGIPVDIRTPGVFIEFDPSRAFQGLATVEHQILVIGQRLAAGTVAQLIPTLITSEEQAEDAFGRGSMLSLMIDALRKVNRTTKTYAIAIDDNGAGVAAAGSVKFGGVVTAAGTLNLYIAGIRVQVAVASGEASAATATKVAAAIVAVTDLPVTAVVDGADNTMVNITARHKGETGNDIDLRVNYFQGEFLPKGLTATFVAMVGGTGNPDLTAVVAAIGDTWYNTWIVPYTDAANLTVVETELNIRWGPLSQIDGHAYTSVRGNLSALLTHGNSRNTEQVTAMGVQDSPIPPWAWATEVGGTAAFHGNIDPARPFQTLPLPGLMAPAEGAIFDRAERDLALHDGISTFKVDPGGLVRIERLITMWQTNAAGVPDVAYLDLNTKLNVSAIRFATRVRMATTFPRHKLGDDGNPFGPGQAIATPGSVYNQMVSLHSLMVERGWTENHDGFKRDLIVERNTDDRNRIDILAVFYLVGQLRVTAIKLQFIL